MIRGGCPNCSGFDPLDGRLPVCRCGSAWAGRPRKGLQRTKPLAQGTKGLARGKGLAPGKGLQRSASAGLARAQAPSAAAVGAAKARKAMTRNSVPAKARPPRVAPDVKAAVLARSGGRCEVGITEACRRRGRSLTSPEGTNQHHRHPGGMGGSKRAEIHAAAGLLQVCGSGNTSGCHGAIESARTVAYEQGWLVKRGQDPADQPVTLWDGRRVLLRGDGYEPIRVGAA